MMHRAPCYNLALITRKGCGNQPNHYHASHGSPFQDPHSTVDKGHDRYHNVSQMHKQKPSCTSQIPFEARVRIHLVVPASGLWLTTMA
jgi:hypothetical protein